MAKFQITGRKRKEWRNKTNIPSTLVLDVEAKDSKAAATKFEKENDKKARLIYSEIDPYEKPESKAETKQESKTHESKSDR